jgi:DICT domain-containing protein
LFDLIADVPGHFLRVKRSMIDISHALEEAATTTTIPCHLFISIQRFSLLEREARRYARLSSAWRHAWVFGVADVEPPQIPNVTPIVIPPHHPLAQEWFVVVDGPEFGAALLTADVSGFAIADESRRFMGLWSADTALVRAASNRMMQALELPPCSWQIDCAASLAIFTQLSNQLVALHEERLLSART